MSNEIGSYAAKTKLPEILRKVAEGESFTITRRGKPVAQITPYKDKESEKIKEAISALMENAKPEVSDDVLLDYKSQGRK